VTGYEPDPYVTKDSGVREEYPTGMRRDTQEGKPRYDLIDASFKKRWAELMMRGAEKYGEDNWRLAETVEEWSRFRASGARHMEQHLAGDRDEDHAAAVAFNLAAEAYVESRLKAKGYTLTWSALGVPQWMDPPGQFDKQAEPTVITPEQYDTIFGTRNFKPEPSFTRGTVVPCEFNARGFRGDCERPNPHVGLHFGGGIYFDDDGYEQEPIRGIDTP
jgi:hypothetical protein